MFATATADWPRIRGILQPGGGVDVALGRSLGLRLGADWLIDLHATDRIGPRHDTDLPRTRWRVTASALFWFGTN